MLPSWVWRVDIGSTDSGYCLNDSPQPVIVAEWKVTEIKSAPGASIRRELEVGASWKSDVELPEKDLNR
jgi:hypothetical protein